MHRGGLDNAVAELRRLYTTFTSDSVSDRLKAQTALLTRVTEDPELFPLILDAAIGNLETFQRSVENAAADDQLPMKYVERLRNGENPIKIYREFKHLTQVELAERLGVSQPLIGRLEAKQSFNCTIDTLQRIAESLGTTVAHLLPRETNRDR